MVVSTALAKGAVDLAQRQVVIRRLDAIQALGAMDVLCIDKTGTLTMNQVTVTEVIDPTDRYAITGMGYGLDGEVQHTAGNTNTIEAAILPFLICNDAKLVDGKVVGDPTEGALVAMAAKAAAIKKSREDQERKEKAEQKRIADEKKEKKKLKWEPPNW